jgi:hypothetical protein
MTAALKTKIISNCGVVRNKLIASALKYNTTYYAYSASASTFLTSLKARRPNAVLIHSHGAGTADGGRIYLKDNSYVSAANLAASGFKAPAGLFYAAVCEGAKYTGLGNAFITAGFKAFIGYRVSVYTARNTQFYKYFFTKATQPNVTVSSALATTKAWANAKSPAWTDVATARIIGSGSVVYLGGKTTTSTVSTDEAGEDMAPAVVGWREVDSFVMGAAETMAVDKAGALYEVQALKSQYGSDLLVGIEDHPEVYRVAYKDKTRGIFLYGVDVDKATGNIVFHGDLD